MGDKRKTTRPTTTYKIRIPDVPDLTEYPTTSSFFCLSKMASAWQKSLRRSDVGPKLPAAEKKKTTLVRPGVGSRKSIGVANIEATEEHPGVVVTAAPPADGRKVSKLSVVNEEEALQEEDFNEDNEDVFAGGIENKGAKPRRPSRSRKSTLGS